MPQLQSAAAHQAAHHKLTCSLCNRQLLPQLRLLLCCLPQRCLEVSLLLPQLLQLRLMLRGVLLLLLLQLLCARHRVLHAGLHALPHLHAAAFASQQQQS